MYVHISRHYYTSRMVSNGHVSLVESVIKKTSFYFSHWVVIIRGAVSP